MRTLVVLADRLGAVLPAAALPALRAADRVLADPSVPAELAVGAERLTSSLTEWPDGSVVLLCTDFLHPLAGSADEVHRTPEPTGAALLDAVAVMDRLRSPGGCPWDAEQTHQSLLTYLVEETYELHEAVDEADRPALREELGDVLLQVAFHARLAEEQPAESRWSIDDVAAGLVTKLVNRHPHVFAETAVSGAAEVHENWEQIKRREKARESSMDGIARTQPALALAAKVLSRAARAGVEVPLPDTSTLGGRLLSLVAAADGEDPEGALRATVRAYAAAVRAAESAR